MSDNGRALETIAKSMKAQGAAYPITGARLILSDLAIDGFEVVDKRNISVGSCGGNVSDELRERIAKLLHDETWFRLPDRESKQLADAILALPGIAVVELPEPMGAERDHVAESMRDRDMWELGQAWVTIERVDRIYMEAGTAYGSVSPAIARDLAAALLAAAEYAEREQ